MALDACEAFGNDNGALACELGEPMLSPPLLFMHNYLLILVQHTTRVALLAHTRIRATDASLRVAC
jgi:hypothetical protein